jgi:hypothetical protein
MPRPVSPWTWRRALRDYGPDDPGLLVSLYTLNTYMDRDGYAWPSQSLWAKGSRVTERTIRRHMERAVALGWLAVETAGRTGQGWRHYAYRACVPDHLQLDDLDESISDALTAQNGGIDPQKGADTIVSSRQAKGADIAVSSPTAPRGQTCGHQAPEGADIQGTTCGHSYVQNVRTQLCPTNSRSETPAYKTPQTEAQRSAPSTRDVSLKREEQEPEVQQRKTSVSDQDLWRTLNEIGPEHEFKVKAIATILCSRYLDVTEDRLWRVINAERAKQKQRQVQP